jgi:hypothetical protein
MVKRVHDWYKLQKDVGSLTSIPQDKRIYDRLKHKDWKINFKFCHDGLKQMFEQKGKDNDKNYDFALITDIELSKKKLSEFKSIAKMLYTDSRYGIYVSALSYYLNPDKHDTSLSGSYSENISKVFHELFSFADRVEDESEVHDFPLKTNRINGILQEGANYIFVHPNIRFYLWKQNV